MEDIVGLFMESHAVDLGDSLDDLHLLFDGDDPSTIVAGLTLILMSILYMINLYRLV